MKIEVIEGRIEHRGVVKVVEGRMEDRGVVGWRGSKVEGERTIYVDVAESRYLPDVDEHVLDGGTIILVDKLNVEVKRNALLALGDVLAEEFTRDKVRTKDGLGGQGGSGVGTKDDILGGAGIPVKHLGVIVRDGLPLLQSVHVLLDMGRVGWKATS